MIAEKIINCRKNNGWSQEELAYKMNVSNQMISNWEYGTTSPTLAEIIKLSKYFNVTIDYLLKDEIPTNLQENVKKITIYEAKKYIKFRKKASWQIAIATLLCILSPITLILLAYASNIPSTGVTAPLMGIVGIGVLFGLVIIAVSIFLYVGFKNEDYLYIEKGEFNLEDDVNVFVKIKKKKYRNKYIFFNILATILCIISPIPLIISSFLDDEQLVMVMLVLLFIIAGIGALIFIVLGIQNESLNKILKIGEYTEKEKKRSPLREVVGSTYWGLIVVVFLVWTYLDHSWDVSWIIFVIAGISFPLILYVCNAISDHNEKRTN